MNILVKYLGLDPLQNVIACLNYQFDAVIFYAYKDTSRKKNNLYNFLKEKCGVKSVRFTSLDNREVYSIKNSISKHKNKKNHYYFDLTGCEGVCSALFTEHCSRYGITAFTYDIYRDVVVDFVKSSRYSLKDVKKRKVKLNVKDVISLSGGIVRNSIDKPIKSDRELRDYKTIVNFKNGHESKWASLLSVLQTIQYRKKENKYPLPTIDLLTCNGKPLIDEETLYLLLNEMEKLGLIKKLKLRPVISYKYSSSFIKQIFDKTGNLFERTVYIKEKKNSDDCISDVELDWDGIILKDQDKDVYNEVDVIKLEGYTLTFISCKDTKKIRNEHLYELKSVALRFGGKYCKMKLACTSKITDSDIARAKSMRIDLEKY